MRDLRKFGTKEWPVHPSGARVLIMCPWRIVMPYLGLVPEDDSSGQAADTGSAMHKAAELFHKGASVAEAIVGMREQVRKYPLAVLAEAAQMFLGYSCDSRNRDANLVLCEEPLAFSIEAAPDDPTGERIEVVATTDQVRFDGYRYKCYDIKTSKRSPVEVMSESWYQMGLYCVGASIKLGKLVEPGGLIMPRNYKPGVDPSSAPVFYLFNYKAAWIDELVWPLRRAVADVRRGAIHHFPDPNGCKYCHQGHPDICFPKLMQLKQELRTTAPAVELSVT